MSADTYRLAASILLLRTIAGKKDEYELLLLHKPRKKDAWQLPQGGVEGSETTEECALRELEEEAGIRDVKVIGKSATVYSYDFPVSYRRFRPDNICGQKIEYIFGMMKGDEAVKVDGKEVDRYQWVKPSTLPRIIKRKEYLHLVQNLCKEAMSELKAGL